MKKFYLIPALALIFSVLSFSKLSAQTNTFDGSSSNNWNTAANWSLNLVPTSAHDVVIPAGFNVTVNTAAVCKTLTLNGGGSNITVTISSGQSLSVTGAVTINGGTGGNDDRTIAVGSATLNCGSVTIANTANDNDDSEIQLSTGTVNVTGNITMNGSALRNAIRFSGAGTVNVGGSVAAGGDIVPASTTAGLVNYNGSGGTQTVKADTYADISFTGGAAKTIASGGIIVTDVVTFTSGIVTSASANSFTINAGGSVTGTSNTSYVNGPVTKIGTTAFDFPVGSSTGNTGYHPISISAPASATTFTAEYKRASASTVGASLKVGILAISHCEYWNLTRPSGSANVDVTISWNANSPCGGAYINTLTGLIMAYYNTSTSQWENSPGSGITNTSSAPYTTGTTLRNSLTSYGAFTFGNTSASGSPLPVKLGSVNAFAKNNGVSVEWTALTELNLSKYVVERSIDGMNFSAIGSVTARNTTDVSNYTFFDAAPAPGNNYYRLKSVDIDGKAAYSSIMKVNMEKSTAGFTVYPNPVRNGSVSFMSAELAQGTYTVKVMNISGQQVYAQQFTHNGGAVSQSVQLPQSVKTGVYSLLLENAGVKVMNKAFIVQ